MKTRIAILFAALAGATFGFWSYGMARTMLETIGFNVRPFLAGVFFAVAGPFMLVAPLVLFVRESPLYPKVWKTPSRCFAGLVAGLFAGSLVSEAAILVDESRFSSEVAHLGGERIYSRARAWPNEICSLVFIPGEGIHSTD